jgi:hypothetical protein
VPVTPSELTPRLTVRIRQDFPVRLDEVVEALQRVDIGNQDRERILASVIIAADGDMLRLQQAVVLSQLDWRDLLVGTGLANADWPQRLDAGFGRSGEHP